MTLLKGNDLAPGGLLGRLCAPCTKTESLLEWAGLDSSLAVLLSAVPIYKKKKLFVSLLVLIAKEIQSFLHTHMSQPTFLKIGFHT